MNDHGLKFEHWPVGIVEENKPFDDFVHLDQADRTVNIPMKAKVYITLKPGILDPQGQAVHHALESLGFDRVFEVRTGKFIEMNYNGVTRDEAERLTRQACEKLLANPVIENYEFVIVE